MCRVFVAGPIDFHDLSDLVAYRLSFRDGLADAGFTPVDQYSAALDRIEGATDDRDALAETLQNLDELPDEPYVRAVGHAILERSISEVLSSPEVVPAVAPESVVADIVERDLELLRSCDAMLAYFPTPSCGTTVELLHAVEHDVPTHVVSESPSMFVQHYADECHETFDAALDRLTDQFGSSEEVRTAAASPTSES